MAKPTFKQIMKYGNLMDQKASSMDLGYVCKFVNGPDPTYLKPTIMNLSNATEESGIPLPLSVGEAIQATTILFTGTPALTCKPVPKEEFPLWFASMEKFSAKYQSFAASTHGTPTFQTHIAAVPSDIYLKTYAFLRNPVLFGNFKQKAPIVQFQEMMSMFTDILPEKPAEPWIDEYAAKVRLQGLEIKHMRQQATRSSFTTNFQKMKKMLMEAFKDTDSNYEAGDDTEMRENSSSMGDDAASQDNTESHDTSLSENPRLQTHPVDTGCGAFGFRAPALPKFPGKKSTQPKAEVSANLGFDTWPWTNYQLPQKQTRDWQKLRP